MCWYSSVIRVNEYLTKGISLDMEVGVQFIVKLYSRQIDIKEI